MLSRSSETLVVPSHQLAAVDLRQRCHKYFSHIRSRCVHMNAFSVRKSSFISHIANILPTKSSICSRNGRLPRGSSDDADSIEQFSSTMIQWQGKQWFSMLELPSELVNLFGSQNGSAKKKKSVTFADDCGSQLVTIQIIAEPSDVPPQIHSEIVRALLASHERLSGESGAEIAAKWIVNFEQPCSNHSSFRRNLNQKNVALENAVIQSDYHRLQGTVRVKNLAFEKEVFIRHTSDGWKTYQDLHANFLRSTGREYDTFVFYLPTPAAASKEKQKIEFCVCYRAKNQEFWDNNENRNYEIISEHLQKKRMQSPAYVHDSVNAFPRPNHASDEWSEFAVWNQVLSKCQYW
ncbi:hypothetical protein M514_05609 [Trichuris suis]|uniref:CBM21 domain-containing protein n=1 Tax=Trichuris suis TaxID=68888 RepID=A0A085M8F7_9BILA|nr:hypothetical protein M513_05609 [Trichuris suis]KFD71826.1 hypothetical protein M514_05609 [Trichuris suis]KHJ41346.1 putative phosphatase regulatory subunit [Trichuris suis]